MANTLEYIYRVTDRFQGPLQEFQRLITKNTKAVDRLDAKFKALQGFLSLLAVRQVALGFEDLLKRAIDVEDAIGDVVRVSNLSGQALDDLENQMESLSESIGVDKIDLLKQSFEGLKLGIPSEEIADFVKLAANVSVAFDTSAQEAGRALGSIQAKMNLTGKDMVRMMDSINYVADNTSADSSQMIDIVERASKSFKALRLPPEIAAGFAAFANQLESTPELAGSALNQLFTKLAKSPKTYKKVLENPIETFKEVLEKYKNMPQAKRLKVLMKQFGERIAPFLSGASESINLFNETMETATDTKAVGSMAREMNNRLGRTSNAWERLTATVENTKEAIGESIKGIFKSIVISLTGITESIKEFIQTHPGIIRAVSAIIIIFTALLAVAGLVASAKGLFVLMGGPLLGFLGIMALKIAAVVAIFSYWAETNNPIIASLGRLWDEIWRLIGGLIEFIGVALGIDMRGLNSGMNAFLWVLTKIGQALSVVIESINAFIVGIRMILKVIPRLSALDFSGAWKEFTNPEGASASARVLSSLGSFFGKEDYANSMSMIADSLEGPKGFMSESAVTHKINRTFEIMNDSKVQDKVDSVIGTTSNDVIKGQVENDVLLNIVPQIPQIVLPSVNLPVNIMPTIPQVEPVPVGAQVAVAKVNEQFAGIQQKAKIAYDQSKISNVEQIVESNPDIYQSVASPSAPPVNVTPSVAVESAAERRITVNNEVSGGILVEAAPNTTVKRKDISLNGGRNLVTNY